MQFGFEEIKGLQRALKPQNHSPGTTHGASDGFETSEPENEFSSKDLENIENLNIDDLDFKTVSDRLAKTLNNVILEGIGNEEKNASGELCPDPISGIDPSEGSNRKLEVLEICLDVIREVLKRGLDDRGSTLNTKQQLQAFLHVAENRFLRDGHSQICTQALSCIANALYENTEAFVAFDEIDGVKRITTFLEQGGHPLHIQRCFRVLSISIRDIQMLIRSGEKKYQSTLLDTVAGIVGNSVAVLAYCIRSRMIFKESNLQTDNPWLELCRETLSLQILLGTILDEKSKKEDSQYVQAMTQLGVLIIEILRLPIDVPRICDIKTRLISLLVFMPDEYAEFLVLHNAFEKIVELLERLMHVTLAGGENDKVEELTLPCLLVLYQAAKSSSRACDNLRDIFLGQFIEIQEKEDQGNDSKDFNNVKDTKNHAPPGSALHYYFQLMRSSSEKVSRVASELMWLLCQENSDTFVAFAGVENAAGLLQMKGLLKIG